MPNIFEKQEEASMAREILNNEVQKEQKIR